MNENFGDFIVRLTENARVSLQHAEKIARETGNGYIGTEHILLGILAQGTSVGAKIMADAGVTLQQAELSLQFSSPSLITGKSIKQLSETALLTLKMAHEQAKDLNQDYLGTEHILYSILKQKNARGTTLLRDLHADVSYIMDELEEYFDRQANEYKELANEQTDIRRKSQRGILHEYGTNLTERAAHGKLDPVVGRSKEKQRLITILSRRTKNNPVLIGEPGVGKTAVVEALAQSIASEDVPDHLLDTQVWQIDLASMIAGTKYRGEFEARLKKLIDEARGNDKIILFIDELHVLVGAGSAEGSMDAANILKPSLARGEIRVIGATTLDEYRKSIEKDAALERRFQSIVVSEPSSQETAAIIRGLKNSYEEHHNITLADEQLHHIVFMADRYLHDRFRPDKTIDVLDEASAIARVSNVKSPAQVRQLRKELALLNDKIDDAVENEQYEKAALYKTRHSALTKKLDALQEKLSSTGKTAITDDHIERAVAAMTGIPLTKLQRSEKSTLRNLEKHLGKSLVGQDHAVEVVSRSIRRNKSGITTGKRPIGSFIFMGPSGVGKTELARVIAREVFGSQDALIKIDMSEFSEKHTASRLVGAPAGYVGYEDGGKLTDKIRKQPYSVVLFDELEKAHSDIYNMLLQIIEDGKLTDAKGRSVDFSNTILILTSNLGADALRTTSPFGFGGNHDDAAQRDEQTAKARKELDRYLRPELLNRFDEIVTFRQLTRQDASKIFDRMATDLRNRLARKHITVRITPSAKKTLLEKGFTSKDGVRPLARVIENEIEHRIAELLLSDEVSAGSIIVFTAKNGQLVAHCEHEGQKVVA